MSNPNTARPGWWNVRKGMTSDAVNATLSAAPQVTAEEKPTHLDEDHDVQSTRKLRSGKRSTE